MHFKQAIIQNITWRFAGLAFVFINNILIARLLGAAQTGEFFYAVSFFTLIITCMRLGVENGIVYLSSKYENATGTLFYLMLPLLFIQSGVVFFLLKYWNIYQKQFDVAAMVIFISANVALYYITAFYQGKKEFFSINFINTLLNFLQMLVLIFFFFSSESLSKEETAVRGNFIFWVLALSVAVQVIYLAIYFRLKYKFYFGRIKVHAPLLRGLFAYSGLTFASSIILFLMSRADFYFVEKYCDAGALGNYVQAAKIGQMALILPGMLGGVVFPFSIGAADAFAEKIAFLCRLLTLFFVLLLVLLLSTGYYVLPWLLGKEFNAVFLIILLLLPGIYGMSIGLIILSYLEGKNKQLVILSANLVVLLLIIAADWYVVPQYKFVGAAVVFSVANLVGTVILLRFFLKHTAVKMRSLFQISFKELKRMI